VVYSIRHVLTVLIVETARKECTEKMSQQQDYKISKEVMSRVGNVIGVLSLYTKGKTQEERLKKAEKIATEIMVQHSKGGLKRASADARSLLELYGLTAIKEATRQLRNAQTKTVAWWSPARPSTYPQTDSDENPRVNPNSQNKDNPTSKYDLATCQKVMADAGITDSEFISKTCSEYLGAQPLRDDGIKGATYSQFRMRLINEGKMGYSQATKIANSLYKVPQGERIETKERMPTGNMGHGGWSKVTTKYPGPTGFSKKAKSASTEPEIPYFVYTFADSNTISRLENLGPETTTNIRSASTQQEIDDVLSMSAYALGRKAEARRARREHNSRIFSAAQESSIPNWAYSCGLVT
jgi:hypothetical protein